MVYGKPGFKVYQDMWFKRNLVSRYTRIYGLWDTWFQGVTGYMVYGRPGFKVLQDIWFMGDLISKCYRIYGLWETWFKGSLPGYVVYMRPNFKVYQDMWFLWETWFQGIPGCAVFMGHLVLRYTKICGFMVLWGTWLQEKFHSQGCLL